MGIRTWAAAAALSVCAWAGQVGAAVYEYTAPDTIIFGEGRHRSFYVSTPEFDMTLGDKLIVHLTIIDNRYVASSLYAVPPNPIMDFGFSHFWSGFSPRETPGRYDNVPRVYDLVTVYSGARDFGNTYVLGGENAFRVWSSPVPELSTWAMMLLGFFGLGVMRLRTRSWSRSQSPRSCGA